MRTKALAGAAISLSVFAALFADAPFKSAGALAAVPPVIREAPPAPVFKEGERVAELRARRERVAGKMGPNSVLVMFSAEPRVYTNDVDYEFRQENNLFYLTNLNQKGATLVLLPGNRETPEILFLPRRNPAAETWTGHMYSPEEARQLSGVGEIWEAREFEPFMRALRTRRAYRPQGDGVLLSSASQAAWPIFAEMRMRKSPTEQALLQHAVDISIEGHERAQAVASRAKWEYEVEAEIDYTLKRRNADNWGYPNIVGCGPDATTLHYEESQGRVNPGDLMLIDAGAEYGHYSADVTRTFPVSGKFSPAQADVYSVVLAAQEAGFKAIRPGAALSDVHNAALAVIKDGLLRLGLITDKESMQYRVWFMHGTSHYLGMNVHDVSVPGARLDAGMTFTVEPGIYIRPDALDYLPKTPENAKFIAAVRPAFEKYKGIGVRIEDDVLVTADGYRNLSGALPRTIPEIESFIARAQREVRVGSVAGVWRSEGE